MRKLCTFLLVAIVATGAYAKQSKEDDLDIIYDEKLVPAYSLPPLLESAEGKLIDNAEDWTNIRRPQILSLFSNMIYGRVPVAKNSVSIDFNLIETKSDYMGGMATRIKVSMNFENSQGKASSLLQIFIPNGVQGAVPAIMAYSFNDTQSEDFDAHPEMPGVTKGGWPVSLMLQRGFALVVVDQSDLVAHNEVEFGANTIQNLFYDKGQSFPRAHEWGVISTIAWGGSRAMDYLETLVSIDHKRVAVMGHSKLGKAALWTAAQDERFAMVIAAQSGAAGAALWRRTSGETLGKMVTRFPYWLSRNAWKFVGNEDDLPVDQHMMIALMAPRPVYVASGQDDGWADPRGEYLSAYYASEVYKLFGLRGLTSKDSPEVGQAIKDGFIGYHVRAGGHSVEQFDIEHFLDFANKHFTK